MCRQLSSRTRQDADAPCLLSSPTLRHNCGAHSERIFDVSSLLITLYRLAQASFDLDTVVLMTRWADR